MDRNASSPVMPTDVLGAVLSSYTNVAEDGTICFVSDKIYRICRACNTIFTDSASRSAFAGAPTCPYCGLPAAEPLPLPTGRPS